MTSTGVREHLRSNVVGYVALFLVVAGGAASALPGRNSVDSGDIKRGQVRKSDLATNAVNSAKVADDSLTGADVDESSLSLPQTPSTLPPSGAAGGDLDGSYPDPSVREAGLNAGGDLSGSLADAQLGPDSVGGPEIAADAVGEAEIEDGIRDILIPAGVIDDSRLGSAGSPAAGVTAVGSYPALLFDPASSETTRFVVELPLDMEAGSAVGVFVLWSAPNTGNATWSRAITAVTPGTAETLADPAFSTASTIDAMTNANGLEQAFLGAAASAVRLGPGDLVKVEIGRNAAAASDTLTGDAALLAVRLRLVTRR